jgi:hypothetical protein
MVQNLLRNPINYYFKVILSLAFFMIALQSFICLEKSMVARSCSAFLASRSNLRAAAPSKTGTLLISIAMIYYGFKLYGKFT